MSADATTGTEDTPGERSFLQRRLGLFGGVLFGVHALGLVVQTLSLPDPRDNLGVLGLMAAVALLNLALFVFARGPARSVRTLRVVEAIVLALEAIGVGAVPHAISAGYLPMLVAPASVDGSARYIASLGPFGTYVYVATGCIIAATHVFVLRAALVPSTARRTAALTIGGGVLLAATFASPLPGWPGDAALQAALPDHTSFFVVVETTVWWSMTTILSIVLSRVIHGLRREIRSARRLGQYHLEAKLGEGGMGVVYRAQHALLRRPTAIKLLPPEKVGEASLARFEREVRLTATLTHPNTVTIYDYGRTPDGIFYYAMELLDGAPIGDVVELDGPQPPGRAVHVLRAIAGALREAHGRGIVHRDVKPGNIVLCEHGGEADVPMLLDFGLVKQIGPEASAALTLEHTITGTPGYLAPEVIRSADAAGPASDLYALGAVAYYLITGTHLFDGGSVVEVCSHHLHTPPEPPSARLGRPVPDALERLVLRLLAKDPSARPSSAEDLLERLDALEDVEEWTAAARRAWWEAHGAALRARKHAVDPGADTVRIDLGAR